MNCSIMTRALLAGMLAIASASPLAAQEQRRMQVVDTDTKRGLESTIDLIDSKNENSRLTATDKDGYFLAPSTCAPGSRMKATPASKSYFAKTVDCPVPSGLELVGLTRIKYIRNLTDNASVLEQNGITGDAALVYNELAIRLLGVDTAKASSARRKSFILAGESLGVSTPLKFDAVQGRRVMSPELKQAVTILQRSKGLKTTGDLDFATLSAVSDVPLSNYLFSPSVDSSIDGILR